MRQREGITSGTRPSPAARALDATSGISSCAGSVADGASIDTSELGTRGFTVNAADSAGNTATVTHAYSVTYEFSGFGAPVANPPAVNEVRAGSRIPFKWTLTGAAGALVADRTDLFQVGWTAAFPFAAATGGPVIGSSPTAGQSGLRWDADAQHYSFEAASTREDAGRCRYFTIRVGSHGVAVALVRFV